MFKKFVAELVAAKSADEAEWVFYKVDGIDMAFQKEKITWKEHQLLLALVDKLYALLPAYTEAENNV